MPKFFIEHPVFAWVVAILISLAGVISILGLGVESYPSIEIGRASCRERV